LFPPHIICADALVARIGFRVNDFQGGFGNRLFFFTGVRKPAMPLPESPTLEAISKVVDALAVIQTCEVHLDANSRVLWEKFYRVWDAEESRRDPLLLAAIQRILPYCCMPRWKEPCQRSRTTS
jgi:hypothetical protein